MNMWKAEKSSRGRICRSRKDARTFVKRWLVVSCDDYKAAGAGQDLIEWFNVFYGEREEWELLFVSDEVAHHKDEWLLSPWMPGLMGGFNWVELNLSQVEMETEKKIYAVDL